MTLDQVYKKFMPITFGTSLNNRIFGQTGKKLCVALRLNIGS